MVNLPILVLPKATQDLRKKGSPKYFSIEHPVPARQKIRLGLKFDRIQDSLSKSDSATISTDTQGLYPDTTIVFELAQPKQNFRKAVEKLGLSWLGEDDVALDPDADFYNAQKPTEPLEGRLYLTSPDQKSLKDLLALWKKYLTNNLQSDSRDWQEVFSSLKDIRRWGAQDRLPPETQKYLALEADARPGETHIHLEIEAIYFGNASKDAAVAMNLANALNAANAEILDSVTIPEIRYHAVLVSIPKAEIKKLQNFESALLKIDEIGYVRPQAMSITPEVDEFSEDNDFSTLTKKKLGNPVAALFDGVPIEQHELLAGRLIINDPEGLQAISPVNTRHHGTAMASLILHGDLPLKSDPLARQLYVHCLLSGTSTSNVETTNKDHLIIGQIYAAVKNLKENSSPATKDIYVVNLSLGDCNRPFYGQISAWARLIDFLSWKYDLLFIVSAGNIDVSLAIEGHKDTSTFKLLPSEEKRNSFIKSMESDSAMRTIFSPAESINALTIGASHSDGSIKLPNAFLVDPFDSGKFPSLISGLGLGYRRAIKPDILHCGGRAMFSFSNGTKCLQFHPSSAIKYFGQEVASAKSLAATTRLIGTSNAAALVTRAAVQLYDNLQELFSKNPSALVTRKHVPCMLKALLVHSASWGSAGTIFDSVVRPKGGKQWKSRRSNITRFLGYGSIDVERVLSCTDHRVTLLGTGAVAPDKAEIFEFPLPPSISSSKLLRRLTITLAWASPIRPGEQTYRAAILDVVPADDEGFPIGAPRVASGQPPTDVARRGTVVHEIFEGKDAVPVVDGDKLKIRVQCRTQGTGLTERVPYALVVTFEVAEGIKADIYQEIASRIGIKPAPRVRA